MVMRYYHSTIGYIKSIKELPFTEITEEEYNTAITAINRKQGFIDKYYKNEITADEIPADIRETVIAEVEAIREAEKREEVIEPTAEEVLNILTGETA
jgi:hypothetical protein